MEKGWKTIKMADAFELQMGKTPSRNNPDYWDGTETWVSIGDMGVSKYIGTSKEQISKKAVSDTGIKLLPQETVIMSFKLSVGKVAITSKPLFTNEAIMSFTPKKGFSFLADYIYYYLKGYKWDGTNRAVMGITLNKASISQGVFSYPSLSEQKRIVAELDLLTDVIDKQKQQLKELDTLAQSIFYDMFGDPVANDKGWEVKKLGSFCDSELGKMLDVKKNKGAIRPYLCSINVQWGRFELSPLKQMGFEENELERYSVKKGDLMICEGGDTGRCAIWNEDYTICYQNALHRVRLDEKVMLPIVCQFIMKVYKDKGEIDTKYSNGQTIKHLVKKTLLTIPMITPFIALQKSFAKKIEAIEKQKENINKSIAETQNLFDYTMDKYFG